MMETMIQVARPEDLAKPRRSRERRESKISYRSNYSGYVGNNTNASARTLPVYSSSSGVSYISNQQLQLQTSASQFQAHDLMGTGYFDVNRQPDGSAGTTSFSSMVHQNYSDDNSWISLSPPHTFGSNPPNSPRTTAGNDGYSPRSEMLQLSDNGQTKSWTAVTPRTSQTGSATEDLSFSGMQLGSSLGSLNNMVFSNNSSISESYVFPYPSSLDSPMNTNQLQDLTLPGPLPDGFFQTSGEQIYDNSSASPLNPVSPLFSPEFTFEDPYYRYGQVYAPGDFQSDEPAIVSPQDDLSPRTLSNGSMHPNVPWYTENQNNNNHFNANTGVIAFAPPPGPTYKTHLVRQNYLDTGQMPSPIVKQPNSPAAESDGGSWHAVSYPSSDYSVSQGSPEPGVSPAAHPSSPVQTQVASILANQPRTVVKIQSPSISRHESEQPHSHLFISGGISKQKLPRGRQRGLTAKEKKEARDVREAKACWACHISKTKCSPCSPGKPCEQCTRLAGKRRFCLFDCFNEPLETLFTFFVPKYLTGHFTKANVERFVQDNALSWGHQYFPIRMNWGYRKPLEAEVATLSLRSNAEMGFQHQTVFKEGMRPVLLRKQSPPLAIPLAAMEDMQETYSRYVQDIVQTDFAEYASTAYCDQDTDFTERLLRVIGGFYTAGRQSNNESELLRRVLEIHVTAVILERSLVLDANCQRQIENHMRERYPDRSAPRCAQRQIKLAFFLLQQRRIMRVLKDWGAIMWATNPSISKDKEWALAFSVFTVLILVMDKTLGSAYYFCENQIQHRGGSAVRERAELETLVRLMQVHLFDRCKEIFHWKFKTRKGGKEACNPIRDGADTFQGKSKDVVDPDVIRFVGELQSVVNEYESDIRLHRSAKEESDSVFTDAGRLACIFLDDFLSR